MAASDRDRDWAWLPQNIIFSIKEKLGKFSDYLRFISVCQQWRHVGLEDTNNSQRLVFLRTCHNRLPMLMVETEEHDQEKRVLFSVTDGKSYELGLPLPCSHRIIGSSHGWLFSIDKNMVITLFNPFDDKVVRLPVFHDPSGQYENWVKDNVHDYFINKGIVLSPRDPRDGVVVIYGSMSRMALLRSSSDGYSWNFIETKPEHYLLHVFSDVIYHKGQLLAVNYRGQLSQIDLATGTTSVMTEECNSLAHTSYLVESSQQDDDEGDLLLVQRFWRDEDDDDYDDDEDGEKRLGKSGDFKVLKFQYTIGEKIDAIWVEIQNLGDQALFLGDNHSVCVLSSEFAGCQANCIYFTDQNHIHAPPYRGLDNDCGIFNLGDSSIHSHYIPNPGENHNLPPIWFVPKL